MRTDRGAREWFAKALMNAGVYTLLEQGVERQFIDGTIDIPLDELVMDSLARMQFCIDVEKRWEVTVTPGGLSDFDTLLELVSFVEGPREH